MAASTTGAFTRLLRALVRDATIGQRIVPIVPDEARTFGIGGLFRQVGIYRPGGQRYEPVDAGLLLSYHEAADGQIIEAPGAADPRQRGGQRPHACGTSETIAPTMAEAIQQE
ncbi:MAG: hypothetical protein ACRDYZ_05030 [Acidimicrobiales bacterium]